MVFFDPRWTGDHGIGVFARHLDAGLALPHLPIGGTPASPFDPLRQLVVMALRVPRTAGVLNPGYNPPLLPLRPYVLTINDLNHVDRSENSSALKRLYYRAVLSGCSSRSCCFTPTRTSTLSLAELSQKLAVGLKAVTGAGLVLVLAGLAFKLAVFPFHMWAADVYEGSPLPSTAVIATASKIAVFAFLYRFLGPMLHPSAAGSAVTGGSALHSVDLALTVLAVASMLGGNLLALRQTNVKRLLAYSSTANLGYLLVPLAAGSPQSLHSAFFYLAIYAAANMGILGTLTLFSSSATEAADLDEYTGLLYRRSAVSASFILMALSLAGLPLSAGFFGKLYLFEAGMAAGRWLLIGVFVAGSTIGLYYYLRLVFVQLSRGSEPGAAPAGGATSLVDTAANPDALVTLAVTFVFVLGIGIFPQQLLSLLQTVGL